VSSRCALRAETYPLSLHDALPILATFRHSGAQFTRDGEVFTDLRAAFDGGGQRLVTVDHDISVDGIDATQRCIALHRWVASMPRSEEHTSELQSRFDLVCRLMLEK